jgi:hypothetical protein
VPVATTRFKTAEGIPGNAIVFGPGPRGVHIALSSPDLNITGQLNSDHAIDNEVEALIAELNNLREPLKQMLADLRARYG